MSDRGHGIDESRVAALLRREQAAFIEAHPGSRAIQDRAQSRLVRGVPMHWMANWASPFTVYVERGQGARVIDVDGNEYVDFCLGDNGSLMGHGHERIAAALRDQVERGSSFMLPTEDALWIADELHRRFGLPLWQFATSATDANRFVIRICRVMTGRDKILVFNGKYHGSVDETHVVLDNGRMVPLEGVSRNAVDYERTTKLVEFNDVDAVERALEERDVACVLTEPVLTNEGGMVLPRPGFHEALRELTRRTDTPLIIDETHTIAMGPRGCAGPFSLDPDLYVLGKAIGGGVPAAVYGMTTEVGDAMAAYTGREGLWANHAGLGGTLAGSALTVRAIRATLEEGMTEDAYAHMASLGERFEQGMSAVISEHGLPWHVSRLGARVSYMFCESPPVTGRDAAVEAAGAADLRVALHLFLLNRGLLIGPFNSTALMCPATTAADVDRHTEHFAAAVAELTAD